MKTNELSVGKVLVSTESANVIPVKTGIQESGSQIPVWDDTLGTATASAQASSSATPKADATIGDGVILTGKASLFINNNQVTNQSKIFVTAATPIAQTIAVTEKVSGVGFMVELKTPEAVEVKFSWWIIN